jgi:uncharacterized membrane protein YkgB
MNGTLDLDPATLRRFGFFRRGGGARLLTAYERLDQAIVRFLQDHGVRLLRWTLGLVFVWFGALKVIDRSPVADLVAQTVPWLPADLFVRGLGIWEIAIGVGLLMGVGLRVVLLIFIAQMAGTFLVLITRPGEAFQDGNPLLLTTIGEFVIKNLVLIAAGLAIGATVQAPSGRIVPRDFPEMSS